MGELINILGAISDSQIPAAIARDTEFAAADAAHVATADPHAQYLLQSEGDALYRSVTATQIFNKDTRCIGISNNIIGEANYSSFYSFGLEARAANSSSGAYMAFHRPGIASFNLGMDTDNQLKVGGWSFGPYAYRIWHEGILDIAKYPQFTRAIFMGNCPNIANGTTYIYHGLDATRIKSFTAFALVYGGTVSEIRIQPGGGVPPWIGTSFYYTVDIGPETIYIRTSTNSGSILNAPVTIVVDYV